MSLWQIFDRISRLARANSFDGPGSSHDEELRRAEELIDAENRRDRMKRSVTEDADRSEPSADEVSDGDENAMTIERACRLLSVPAGATDREITVAYRKKILEIHPDRHLNQSPPQEAEARARTQELNRAYAFLKQQIRLSDH